MLCQLLVNQENPTINETIKGETDLRLKLKRLYDRGQELSETHSSIGNSYRN